MLTAEYGGSGGKAIESGLVVEEPDIEIGAGVSSKGKSSLDYQPRKEANDATQQSADGWPPTRAARLALGLRAGDQKLARATVEVNTIGVPPAVPGFGFQFPNGMPMFPPGFVLPGIAPTQPPPPGHLG